MSLGVDWVTFTANDMHDAERLLAWSSEAVTTQMRLGFQRKGWGLSGFTGFQCGQVQYGVRNREAIVRLSGETADNSWRLLYELSTNCSRVDIQCTSRNDTSAAQRIRKYARQAQAYSREKAGRSSTTLLFCTDGGSTVYLGKRQSERMGRIYDKGVQSGQSYWSEAVRHEAEFKGAAAWSIIRTLFRARDNYTPCAQVLRGFFERRGVTLPFLEVPPFLLEVRRPPANNQSYLEWLRKQVSPGVKRLIACGMLSEVTEALGLPPELNAPSGRLAQMVQESKGVH